MNTHKSIPLNNRESVDIFIKGGELVLLIETTSGVHSVGITTAKNAQEIVDALNALIPRIGKTDEEIKIEKAQKSLTFWLEHLNNYGFSQASVDVVGIGGFHPDNCPDAWRGEWINQKHQGELYDVKFLDDGRIDRVQLVNNVIFVKWTD